MSMLKSITGSSPVMITIVCGYNSVKTLYLSGGGMVDANARQLDVWIEG